MSPQNSTKPPGTAPRNGKGSHAVYTADRDARRARLSVAFCIEVNAELVDAAWHAQLRIGLNALRGKMPHGEAHYNKKNVVDVHALVARGCPSNMSLETDSD